jgi:hypothetical protein
VAARIVGAASFEQAHNVLGLLIGLLADDALEDDLAPARDFDLDMIDSLLARDIDRTREGRFGKLGSTS